MADEIVVIGRAYIQPRAAWKVTLDGQDLTSKLAPRLVSLRLSEKRGEEADELEIVLDDGDGKVNLPPEGAVLKVQLGWERGSEVTLGLVDKGSFTVDEVSWSGAPDQVSIRARSADLKSSYRTRRNKTWTDTTLGAIVGAIAGNHGLAVRCHVELKTKAISSAEQAGKSDMQFLRDLARRYDATASVKGGCLIFTPVGASTSASGAELPTGTITRDQCSSVSWRRAARDNAQDGAEAQWHDREANERKKVGSGGNNPKRLKKVYASEADAKAASDAESKRLNRAAASLELTMAYGSPRLSPDMKVTVAGFKPQIDATAWLIASAEHEMGARGLATRLNLEVAT